MLHLETSGTWREMGRQLGETFRDEIARGVERFAPWLVSEAKRYRPAVNRLRAMLAEHAPDLLDEARGMAEGAGLSEAVGLGYRLFNQVRSFVEVGCSVIFQQTDQGPLLARNCDLYPREHEFQVCQVRRPVGQPASLVLCYVGLAGGSGLNEHGLGISGASAYAEPVQIAGGWPGPVIEHRVLQDCWTVAEARRALAGVRYRGKPVNQMVADAEGDCTVFEFVPGAPIRAIDRPAGRSWQVTTNFFASGAVPTPGNPGYLANAYARYGRMVHALEGAAPTFDTVAAVLRDVAQPGQCCPETEGAMRTAYTQIMDLRERCLWLCASHPGAGTYVPVSL